MYVGRCGSICYACGGCRARQGPEILPDDDPYGSKHVGVICAIKVTTCDNILIIYMSA